MAAEIKKLLRDYRRGAITRREFMRRAVALTGSIAAANILINSFAEANAYTGEVALDDPAVVCKDVEFSGNAGPIFGYLARPSASGKFPAVVIIHANQGLNDYTRDVARRLAKQNYAAVAVDFLSRRGGTAKVNPKGEGLNNIRELEPWQAVAEDAGSAYGYLQTLPEVRSDRRGLVGFCWGGEMTFSSATEVRGLGAVVVFYGRSPQPLDRLKNVQAPVLAHYGEKDPGVNQDIPGTEEAMKRYGKSYTYKVYTGAQHGFHTDNSAERYHAQAAKEAWAKTLEFFKQQLQS